MANGQPSPADLVGETAYLETFSEQVTTGDFPNPDADLVPELTKARFVIKAAHDTGDATFAEQLESQRETVFNPFYVRGSRNTQ